MPALSSWARMTSGRDPVCSAALHPKMGQFKPDLDCFLGALLLQVSAYPKPTGLRMTQRRLGVNAKTSKFLCICQSRATGFSIFPLWKPKESLWTETSFQHSSPVSAHQIPNIFSSCLYEQNVEYEQTVKKVTAMTFDEKQIW